jgi:hypothetical protein
MCSRILTLFFAVAVNPPLLIGHGQIMRKWHHIHSFVACLGPTDSLGLVGFHIQRRPGGAPNIARPGGVPHIVLAWWGCTYSVGLVGHHILYS